MRASPEGEMLGMLDKLNKGVEFDPEAVFAVAMESENAAALFLQKDNNIVKNLASSDIKEKDILSFGKSFPKLIKPLLEKSDLLANAPELAGKLRAINNGNIVSKFKKIISKLRHSKSPANTTFVQTPSYNKPVPETLLKFISNNTTRPIAIVGQKYPMYRSTGMNSKQAGTFFPFAGVYTKDFPFLKTQKGAFAKPNLQVTNGNLNREHFPEKVLEYMKEHQVDDDVMMRMGNIECMAISSEIGGGYWDSTEGGALKQFMEEQFPEYMQEIRDAYKEDIEALAAIDSIPEDQFEIIEDSCKINDHIMGEINDFKVDDYSGCPEFPDAFKVKDMPEPQSDQRLSI